MSGELKPVEDRRLVAIALMIGAFFCFMGIDTCAKWLVTRGMPVTEAVFVRYLGHFLLVLAISGPALGMSLARSKAPAITIARAFALMISTAFNFAALQYLPLSLTMSIFFAAPLIVCALSIPVLGETVGWRRWAAIGVGFAGVLIVVRPGLGDVHWAAIFSIGAVTCASIYFVLTRKAAGRDTTEVQQFYAAGLATLCLAPFAAPVWQWPVGIDWLAFVLIGLFGWLGHQLLIIGHRFAPASVLAPFVYLQLIFMVASGWIFFADIPDIWVMIGAAVVMASGLYIWLRERQLSESS
ncbi:MAG: DMT family transporter [Pseudomonadota bacterium]